MAFCERNSGTKSGRELLKGSKVTASLLICIQQKKFWLGVRIFCEWHYKWSTFKPPWPTSPGPGAKPLRPLYTEKLSGVAAHDSLFVLLRLPVAMLSRAQIQNYLTQQSKQRIMPGNSWHVLSYPLYTAFLSDWRVSDSSPLAYPHEGTCELHIGAFKRFASCAWLMVLQKPGNRCK